MTVMDAVALGMVLLVGLGCILVILACIIVGNANAQHPWYCPVCGENYPCAEHGSELE